MRRVLHCILSFDFKRMNGNDDDDSYDDDKILKCKIKRGENER